MFGRVTEEIKKCIKNQISKKVQGEIAMFKKSFAILLSCCMLAGSFSVSGYAADVSAGCETARPVNANDGVMNTKQYTMGTKVSGTLSKEIKGDTYNFTLAESGRISLDFTGEFRGVRLKFYNPAGENVGDDNTYYGQDASTGLVRETQELDLTKGNYQFIVERNTNTSSGIDWGDYEFTMTFTSAQESFPEEMGGSDDSLADSNVINLDTSYKGQIAHNEDGDFYKFTIPSSGKAALNFTGYLRNMCIRLYDSNYKEVWDSGSKRWNESTHLILISEELNLLKGTYYLKMESLLKDYTGNYEFGVNFTSAEESFEEAVGGNGNDNHTTSSEIKTNTQYKGQLAINEGSDFYKFTVKETGSVDVNFSGTMYRVCLHIYDSSVKEVWKVNGRFDDDIGVNLINETVDLTSGSYYFLVEKGGDSLQYTGNYSFSIATEEAKPITGVSVSPASLTLTEGETGTLAASVVPADTTDDKTITWKSGNTAVATVDQNGKVTAVAAGTTTITATAVNGKSASCQVTVKKEEVTVEPKLPFTDFGVGVWYYETVKDVYNKGLMTGLTDTIFGPNDKLARAQFATILWRMEDEPAVTFEQKFPDVITGQFYTESVLWAANAGIVTGYTDTGKFGPGDNINREQIAVMMFRYANYLGLDTSQRADFSSYPDAANVNSFAKDAMSWCVANGIITGDNGRLNPQGETVRAVCATIISRFYSAYDL